MNLLRPFHLIRLFFWLLLTLATGTNPAFAQRTYDVVLRNGKIIDGSGKAAFSGDIAIKDRRIVRIGAIAPESASVEYDAAGLVVAPGFIDVHTHAEDIDDLPLAENFVRMGVTTLVLGNCGASALNVGEFFRRLEQLTISPNVATLIGHGTIRRRAMRGNFDREPTPEELEQMRSLVARAMADGALGLSTGLIYMPGVFAKTEEIVELAKVAAASGGIYASHQRSESDKIFDSLDEVFTVARESGIRAHISHIKLSGPANWGQAAKVLEAIDRASASGLTLTQDQYAYTASSTGISQLVPDEMKEGGAERYLERLATPEFKERMVAKMKETLQKRRSDDYSYAVIASYRHNRSLNGLNIVEAAKRVRGSDSLDDQIELIFEIHKNGGATGVFHGMSEEDLEAFMRHPKTMFASDSGVRRYKSAVPHPRGYGNNARILARYVREKGVLSLEEGIRKMTSLPAATFQLQDRGELRQGAWADLVVFDPEKIADHATFNDPHHYSIGFKYVFVNGQLVVHEDRHTGARPGAIIRHEKRQPPSQEKADASKAAND